MGRLVVVDRFYEGTEREIVLDRPDMTVYEAIAQLNRDLPHFFAPQDPAMPLPVFPADVRFRLPTAVLGPDGSGEPAYVKQATWHTRVIGPDETIAFVPVPRGGGGGSGSNSGKQVAAVVASLALAIAAPYLVAGVGVAAFTTAAGTLSPLGTLAASGLVIGGSLLLNLLAPKPETPATEDFESYTVSAASNRANPGGVMPVWYGRLRLPPPFLTKPYQEFEGNDQFLYQVLMTTCGEIEYERIEIGDTEVWNPVDGVTGTVDDLEFEFIDPGGEITLFPAGVITASEVSGQEVPNPPGILGPFVVNPAGASNRVNRLAVDLIFPEGLYYVTDEGELQVNLVDVRMQYREIDDAGAPVGAGTWLDIENNGNGDNGSHRIVRGTREPQRITYRKAVAKGRYEVRFSSERDFSAADDKNSKNKLLWGGLKGYIAGFKTPPGVSLIAVKIKANEDFNQFSSNEIFVTGTRKLPTYNASTKTWSAPVATRSIAWATADWLRDTDYGAGLADTKYDLDWLEAYDSLWDGRGDTFNAVFDREWTVGVATNAILDAGDAQIIRLGGRIGFVRDEARDIRRATFTPRNIVKGSFWQEFIFADDESPDSLYIKFINEDTWIEDEVKAELSTYSGEAPVEEDAFGSTNHDHAWRRGLRRVAKNAYRRQFVGFVTEMEGLDLVRLDPINVSHPLMGVANAQVRSVDANTLTLDSDIVQSPAPQYFESDGADWTNQNAGAASSLPDLSGTFVDDATLDARAAVRSGTAANSIRHKRALDVPTDGQIVELQVVWRVEGAGQGRVRGRCVALDDAYVQIGGAIGGYSDLKTSTDGKQTTQFYFAADAASGIEAWATTAARLRFGVNVNDSGGGAEVRISQVRLRYVWGTEDSVYLRGKDGREWGPCDVNKIQDDRTIKLNATDLAAVEAQDGTIASILPAARSEKAHLVLYQDNAPTFDGLVVSARPTGNNQVEVIAQLDAPEVYSADGTETPPPYLRPPTPPKVPDRPIVSGLYGNLARYDFDIRLAAGWLPAAGARRYKAEVSYDNGASWTPVYAGEDNRFTATVKAQELKVRVRGIGKRAGPWAELSIAQSEVPPVEPPPGVIKIEHLDPDVQGNLQRIEEDSQAFLNIGLDNLRETMEELTALVAENGAFMELTKNSIITAVVQQSEDARAAVIRIDRAIVDEKEARAESILGLEARLTSVEGDQSGIALALQELVVRVQDTEDGLDLLASDILTLFGVVNDSVTGNSALAALISSQGIRITANEGEITSIANATTLLTTRVGNVEGDVSGLSTAFDNLETQVNLNKDGLKVNALRDTLLSAKVQQFLPTNVWKGKTVLLTKASAANGTISGGLDDTARLRGSGSKPGYVFNLSTDMQFDGNGSPVVQIVGRWRGAGSDFKGRLQYKTNGHGYGNSWYKDAAHPWGTGDAQDDEFVVMTFDMSDLDAGGNNWINNTITGLKFIPSDDQAVDFELAHIGWGQLEDSALGAVLEADAAQATQTKKGLESLASSLKSVVAETEDGYAEGLIAMEAQSGPSGVASRMALRVRAGVEDNFEQAALYLDAMQGGGSQAVIEAENFAFTHNDEKVYPFYISGGVVYIENAHIRNLKSNNLKRREITVPTLGSFSNVQNIGISEKKVASITMDLDDEVEFVRIEFLVHAQITYTDVAQPDTVGGVTFRLFRGGQEVNKFNFDMLNLSASQMLFDRTIAFIDENPPSVETKYDLFASTNSNQVNCRTYNDGSVSGNAYKR